MSSSSMAHGCNEASWCTALIIFRRVLGTSSWCLVSRWVRNCAFTIPCLWLLHTAMQCVGRYSKMVLNGSIVFELYIKKSLPGLLPPRSYFNKVSFHARLSILCRSILPIESFSHFRRNLYGNRWRFTGSTASSCIQLFNSFSSSSRVRLCPL
jgi:hypothetical protein